MNYHIYLDVCCLNRPLDDLDQIRIRLEAEAVTEIIQNCENHIWTLVNSDIIEFEVERHSDAFKKELINAVLAQTQRYLKTTPSIQERARALMQLSFKFHDALHLAFAEAGQVDIFLTTDDRLLRKVRHHQDLITVAVDNPTVWLMRTLQQTEDTNETSGN